MKGPVQSSQDKACHAQVWTYFSCIFGCAKGKPKIEVYDKDRKKEIGALLTAAKTYNPSLDLVMEKSNELETEMITDGDEATATKKRKHEEEAVEPNLENGKKRRKKKVEVENVDEVQEVKEKKKDNKKKVGKVTKQKGEQQHSVMVG